MRVSRETTLNFMSMQRRFSSKLSKPYSDCDIENLNPGYINSPFYNLILKSPYQYSQDLCVIQCIQQHVIQMCNCSIPIYLDLYNVSCKNIDESLCANETPYNGQLNSFIPNCVTQCPLECNSNVQIMNICANIVNSCMLNTKIIFFFMFDHILPNFLSISYNFNLLEKRDFLKSHFFP
jgi:hypothetical protein